MIWNWFCGYHTISKAARKLSAPTHYLFSSLLLSNHVFSKPLPIDHGRFDPRTSNGSHFHLFRRKSTFSKSNGFQGAYFALFTAKFGFFTKIGATRSVKFLHPRFSSFTAPLTGIHTRLPILLFACSPILPTWNRVRLPFSDCSPKMPAWSGYFSRYTGKSVLQAGKIGLQLMANLDSLLQLGYFGFQHIEEP